MDWVTGGPRPASPSCSVRAIPSAGKQTGQEVARRAGSERVWGTNNTECAHAARGIVLAPEPWKGHDAMLEQLRDRLVGKIVIDCVNPLGFDDRGPSGWSIPEGSAAQQAEKLLPESRVTGGLSCRRIDDGIRPRPGGVGHLRTSGTSGRVRVAAPRCPRPC